MTEEFPSMFMRVPNGSLINLMHITTVFVSEARSNETKQVEGFMVFGLAPGHPQGIELSPVMATREQAVAILQDIAFHLQAFDPDKERIEKIVG